MARGLRFVPEGGSLVEVTVRTAQSRFFLRPSPDLNDIVLGILGRAQRLYGVRIHFVVCLSNHWHALLSVDDALQLCRFMQYVNSNLAREANKKNGSSGPFWSTRYRAILVSEEEPAQVDRLRYLLAQGVKENLVERVLEWPGVHSARAILEGMSLKGYWFDRTQENAARERGEDFGRFAYATEEEVVLTPLPCWAHLTPEQYRERVAALVEEIEAEARAAREQTQIPPLGVGQILRQNPQGVPNKTKKSPAPLFHAATREAREAFREAYWTFVAAFREAAEKLKAGDRLARFPVGSFPPGLPFVSAFAALPP
jgi:hypothetical protein